jgi:hypothetical protein
MFSRWSGNNILGKFYSCVNILNSGGSRNRGLDLKLFWDCFWILILLAIFILSYIRNMIEILATLLGLV